MDSISTQRTIPDVEAEVLTALEKMQSERTTLRSQVTTLGLSLLAFIIVGWVLVALSDELQFINLFVVIIVLFIHEAGHYLGMRQFGYRNLKMFFIPFFGAAVNGYACVPVTKESIVYLLGPVPGIILGCISGIVYLLTHETLWLDAARIFITINTINLLPLYPLDGGQFIFGILPRNTYRLQWLLQILFIILAVIVIWQFSASLVGGLLGFVLIRSWYLHKSNKIVSTLLEKGIIDPQMPDDTIPPDIAPKIISIVQQETSFTKPKEIAESTWAVWTRAKAERPTARELAFLLMIYLGAMALGIIVWFTSLSGL
jgi:Zn-dependent protease